MNVLFLTLLDFNTIEESGIYTDLMREFVNNNHQLYIISPSEKRNKQPTKMIKKDIYIILKPQIGNFQKSNLLEKAVSTFTLESIFMRSIKEQYANVKFDLVIYSTPPITLQKAVEFVKNRDGAKSYLLLKDIFPQNAVDLGMMSKSGVRSIPYRLFKSKEKKLYKSSDYIGCMSQANVDFLVKENPELKKESVEICPNSINPTSLNIDEQIKKDIRKKYNIPSDKTIFIYGGNLGKPQGIDFLIKCLERNKFNKEVYFIIAGSGTEFGKLNSYFENNAPPNAQLFQQLPKEDYEVLANSCDVGLIFLDHRFTIPNFPSRLLSYMQASMPVLAATDPNTDIGQVIEDGKFGYWCESNDVEAFNHKVKKLNDKILREELGKNARKYLEENYTPKHSYDIIINHFKK
ncbi:glycosyltransferase family 4 protein [Planococcus salinus]|uniref:Glycosyltransferase WbuB n=1 Tax=Planococcus salinus TaxID=1848460 RepID=A0A3M8P7F8_9BACL|nr:glycosyltransferase family 4 protein [Planococcus salinus]RNF39628.1 glycosyltransferase WbuB [Planococcus salinus]